MASKPLATWEVKDVTAWLEGLGLGALAPAFKFNAVGGADLAELTADDLTGTLGCTNTQATRVLAEVQRLQAPGAPPAAISQPPPMSSQPSGGAPAAYPPPSSQSSGGAPAAYPPPASQPSGGVPAGYPPPASQPSGGAPAGYPPPLANQPSGPPAVYPPPSSQPPGGRPPGYPGPAGYPGPQAQHSAYGMPPPGYGGGQPHGQVVSEHVELERYCGPCSILCCILFAFPCVICCPCDVRPVRVVEVHGARGLDGDMPADMQGASTRSVGGEGKSQRSLEAEE